ncbi:TPA: hypothetical protein DCQ44_00940, partial [Candidatus Taylorbacteria bacterium]|nr:hypothetical protein [Candidatus Taylorbacteria bacterium]
MKKYIWVAVVVAAFLVSPTNTHAQSSGTYDGCLPSYAYSPLTGAPCGKTAVAVFVDQTVFLQTGPNPVIYGSASGLSSIGLSLEDSGGGKSYGSGSIPIVNGRWSVVISPALAIGTYKIHIYDSNNQLLSTEGPLKVTGTSTLPPGCLSTSGYSTTTGQSCSSGSTSPSITVLNPNGGENWEKGETHRILWTSQGIDKVSLYVYNDSLYGSGSTNYLDPSGVSLSVPASQGYFDWTIPTNSFLPTPTTGNEGRYKIRIDGPNPDLTGVRDSSDNYFTITSPSSASNVSASIVGTPTLALTYNSSRKESGLTATFKVQVVTGSAAVQIHTISESVVVEDSVSEHSMYNGATLTPTTPLASDGNYFTIPANTKVQFNAIAGFDPSQMFAGSYSATFLGLSTPGQKIQAFGSKTNSLTIVGERSPYISSNQQVGSKLTLTGQRFLASIGGNPTVTTLYIDKTAFTTGVSVTPTTLTFTLPSFVNPGVHAFQIGNSTGKSNVVNINTTVQQDVLPSTASVSVTGTPTLSLTYDSALKESQLTANFNVSVTAGKTPMTLPTNSFFFVATAADNQNHTVGYSTATTEINSANGAYTIPAGTTRTFNLTAYFQPSMMFAGSYSVRLNSLTLDWNGHYLYPANKAYTNNITIIGERSPYITSISSPAGVNDVVTVTGVRFNSNDSIVIDGTPFFSGKGDLVIRSTSMTFTPSKFHLSNGPHAVVISDPVTGLSNSMGLILSGSNQTPASASVVGAPMLTLAYDSSRKESSLVSTFTISVTAGSEQILVSQNQYADLVYSDGTNSNVSATQSFQPITSLGTIADSGSLFYVLPAGTKAQFILKRTYNPKWMFAGTYRAYVSSLQTFAVGGTKSLYIPSNTTNNITVVGETSPYITSSQIVGSKLTLTGQRFLASIGGNPT